MELLYMINQNKKNTTLKYLRKGNILMYKLKYISHKFIKVDKSIRAKTSIITLDDQKKREGRKREMTDMYKCIHTHIHTELKRGFFSRVCTSFGNPKVLVHRTRV